MKNKKRNQLGGSSMDLENFKERRKHDKQMISEMVKTLNSIEFIKYDPETEEERKYNNESRQ